MTGDLLDELTWRRFQARHLYAVALSTQRAEWYAQSTRLYVMWWFWLTLVAAIAVGVLVGVGLSEESSGF